MRPGIVALALVVALGLAAGLGLAALGLGEYLGAGALFEDRGEPVMVGWSPYESTALFWVAEDRHLFRENGVCITLRRYDSGAASLDGVVNGDAAIAVGVTEFPLVRQAFEGADVRAIACIDRGEFNYLVARSDRGIRDVPDLRGKRVGVTAGTIVEFHLARFLALHGVSREEVVLVDLRTPGEWVNAAADGTVDAVATAQPYADAAEARLGANAVVWPIQSDQPLYAMAVAGGDWLDGHPETARRFLASLADAEQYLAGHPAESRAIVRDRLDLDPGYMDTVWKQNRFAVSLDQSLVAAMEDEGRWLIANNLTNATRIPDFREYIDVAPLERILPDNVRIYGDAPGATATTETGAVR